MKNVIKYPHGAGGYVFKLKSEKTNVRLGIENRNKITKHLNNSDVEGVYQTQKGNKIVIFLNGTTFCV